MIDEKTDNCCRFALHSRKVGKVEAGSAACILALPWETGKTNIGQN
jgi:hypothetical protein